MCKPRASLAQASCKQLVQRVTGQSRTPQKGSRKVFAQDSGASIQQNQMKRNSRKFLAHDEAEACGLGDVVRISPCRPLSRRKHFVVQEILKKGDGL